MHVTIALHRISTNFQSGNSTTMSRSIAKTKHIFFESGQIVLMYPDRGQ